MMGLMHDKGENFWPKNLPLISCHWEREVKGWLLVWCIYSLKHVKPFIVDMDNIMRLICPEWIVNVITINLSRSANASLTAPLLILLWKLPLLCVELLLHKSIKLFFTHRGEKEKILLNSPKEKRNTHTVPYTSHTRLSFEIYKWSQQDKRPGAEKPQKSVLEALSKLLPLSSHFANRCHAPQNKTFCSLTMWNMGYFIHD